MTHQESHDAGVEKYAFGKIGSQTERLVNDKRSLDPWCSPETRENPLNQHSGIFQQMIGPHPTALLPSAWCPSLQVDYTAANLWVRAGQSVFTLNKDLSKLKTPNSMAINFMHHDYISVFFDKCIIVMSYLVLYIENKISFTFSVFRMQF